VPRIARVKEPKQIDAIRDYVANATGGISIGAAVMIFVPIDVIRAAGLENANQMVAIKTTLVAAAVSLVARRFRIIRRK
jgi:hypothetical protein